MSASKLDQAGRLAAAAAVAALLGGLTGEKLWFAISTFGDDVSQLGAADAVIIPLSIIGGATVSSGVLFAGIVVLGVPLFLGLKDQIHRHWLAGIAVLIGGIAGWLVYRGISSAYDPETQRRMGDIGVLYGAPAGLFWILLARRLVGRTQKEL